MRPYLLTAIAFSLACPIGLPAAPDRPPKATQGKTAAKDLALLQGRWEVLSIEQDGKPEPKADRRWFGMTVKGNRTFALDQAGNANPREPEYTFRLDPSQRPAAIDQTIRDADCPPETERGIYELRGDRLTLCLAGVGDRRPATFTTKKSDGRILVTFRRAKAAKGKSGR